MEKYRSEFDYCFGYLQSEYGFKMNSYSEEPPAFDWFVAEFQREDIKLKVQRDRSQVFIDFALVGKPWQDKEDILESLGISRSRFATIDGLWEGYKIENQSQDLKQHFNLLVNHIKKM
jgi:hypothetical protein